MGAQPWGAWFGKAKASDYATRNATLCLASGGDRCGAGGAWLSLNASHGNDAAAGDAGNDAYVAYLQALLWSYYSGESVYAERSVAILDSWAGLWSITAGGDQKRLQAGWMGADFAPAVEIMRSYPGWPKEQFAAFQAMLRRAVYPLLQTASPWNGNVDLTQIYAMMSISEVNDDDALFQQALERLDKRILSYFYLVSDGLQPPPIAGDGGKNVSGFWSDPPRPWRDGLMQETCRDNGHHALYALGSALHALEVAYNQGVDVYAKYEKRITAAMELLVLQLRSGSMQCVWNTDSV